jgi:low temperature requirement protein LtrA
MTATAALRPCPPSPPLHRAGSGRGASRRDAARAALRPDVRRRVRVAGNELAGYLATGGIRPGIFGFVFAIFAVSWAWINYSWFASAYDTDDWVFRVATMVQMVGVIVLALGLQQAFSSIARGDVLDNGVMVAGYVVMRVPMVFLWAQVARHDAPRRRAASVYIWTISVAQVFWVVLAIIDLPLE